MENIPERSTITMVEVHRNGLISRGGSEVIPDVSPFQSAKDSGWMSETYGIRFE